MHVTCCLVQSFDVCIRKDLAQARQYVVHHSTGTVGETQNLVHVVGKSKHFHIIEAKPFAKYHGCDDICHYNEDVIIEAWRFAFQVIKMVEVILDHTKGDGLQFRQSFTVHAQVLHPNLLLLFHVLVVRMSDKTLVSIGYMYCASVCYLPVCKIMGPSNQYLKVKYILFNIL